MKTIHLFFYFLHFIVLSQTGVVEYEMLYKESFSNDLPKELKGIIEDDAPSAIFNLLIDGNKSIFYKEDVLQVSKNKVNLLDIKAKLIGTIFLNISDNIYFQKKQVYGKQFVIRDELIKYNWQLIDNETKMIDNKICNKAILSEIIYQQIENDKNEIQVIKKEKTTVAWYCPEINLNFGPIGYYGLPGLIMILEDDIFVYQVKNVKFEINVTQRKKICPPESENFVTNDEYKIQYEKLKAEKENSMKN